MEETKAKQELTTDEKMRLNRLRTHLNHTVGALRAADSLWSEASHIDEAIRHLTIEQQKVINGFFKCGLSSADDIARLYNIRSTRVPPAYRQAIDKLSKILEAPDDEDLCVPKEVSRALTLWGVFAHLKELKETTPGRRSLW